MLKSTILFIAIVADISAKVELQPKELMEIATSVANEKEFIGNEEIQSILKDLPTDKALIQLKKVAYKCHLKDMV